MGIEQQNKKLTVVFPLFLGITCFLAFVGYKTLNTKNIIWLQSGDPIQNYLSWAFFQNSPWSLPIGLNPQFGLDISNSIVYAGGIPVFSFIFKALSPLLTEPFQYSGIWLLLCFITHSYLAWLLTSLLTKRTFAIVLGSTILTVAPPMLFRIGLHNDLACHAIVIAAIYLVIKKDTANTEFKWLLLAGISASVHIYFLAIILIMWFVDMVFKVHRPFANAIIKIFLNLITMIGMLVFIFWLYGYFEVKGDSISATGFGVYRMNLLSLINPMGWSIGLKHLYTNPNFGDYEGFNYLGAGLIFLIFINLKSLTQNIRTISRELLDTQKSILAALLLLSILSASNNIGIGPYNFYIPLPDAILHLMAPLRSSGRLFWPVWYCIALGLIWTTLRYNPQKKSFYILLLAAVIQIVDTSAGWYSTFKQINSSTGSQFDSPLKDAFWKEAASHYKNIIKIPLRQPTQMYEPHWEVWASLALQNNMGTNSAYLSRYDTSKLEDAKSKIGQQISSGKFKKDNLFIIDDDLVGVVNLNLDSTSDLFARIDGFNVLAPGWLKCAQCSLPSHYKPITKIHLSATKDGLFTFNKNGDGVSFLIDVGVGETKGDTGWAFPESWGTWITGREAKLVLPIASGSTQDITLDFKSISPIKDINNNVKIYLNGELAKIDHFQNQSEIYQLKLKANQKVTSQGYLEIKIEPLVRLSPKNSNLSDDDRLLSFGLISISLNSKQGN